MPFRSATIDFLSAYARRQGTVGVFANREKRTPVLDISINR